MGTNRYLATIESLIIENSRLTKELQNSIEGKIPANIVPQELAELCFQSIAKIFGPTARGNLLDEVTLLCNEFVKVCDAYTTTSSQLQKLSKEKEIIENAVKGNDTDDTPTPLSSKVIRLRGVIEVIKTRLDRLYNTSSWGSCGQAEIVNLRKNVTDFLSSDVNE